MRSTRATFAVARLNERSAGRDYRLVVLSGGLFELRERIADVEQPVSGALVLDEFVRFVDAHGPQKALRVTKNDAAFARQLVRKPRS